MGLSRLHDAVLWNNGKVYFFGDRSQYLRYDLASDRADPGYPKPISETWIGWPWHEAPTGAVEWGGGKAYFFYGYSYSRYDMAENRVEPGYPKPIEDLWPGMFTADVQAAINWGDGTAFFFSGSAYIRYDIATGRSIAGFPRPIAEGWPGLWADGTICSAFNWGNGKAYFFREPGDQYLRWDIATNKPDPGYPQATVERWEGLFEP
jgi:hypothetical protein